MREDVRESLCGLRVLCGEYVFGKGAQLRMNVDCSAASAISAVKSTVLAAAMLIIFNAAALTAQTAIVQGRVVERGTGEPINGATVELSGVGRLVTNPTGAFTFASAKLGRRTLTVKMIGYRNRETRIDITGNLSVPIELEVEAVRLEGVTATNKTYTIRGDVIDQAGAPIMDVEVLLGPDRRTFSNINGRFKLSRIRVGQPQLLQVRGLGMMPFAAMVDAGRDTALRVVLAVDPVGQRMIAQQVTRLEQRTHGVPYSIQHMDRAELMRQANLTLYDLVRYRLRANVTTVPCLFIDEFRSVFGVGELMNYLPDQIERIEIVDRGTMVRVYTRRYVQQMIRKRANPMPIVLIETPMGLTCQ